MIQKKMKRNCNDKKKNIKSNENKKKNIKAIKDDNNDTRSEG